MQYAQLGSTGLKVSRLGFGVMRLPTLVEGDPEVDLVKSEKLLRHAFDLGVNYVDCQFAYCNWQGEVAIGMAIKGLPRDKLVIQTKACYYGRPDYEPGETHFTRVGKALKKLGTDYIDVYLMHNLCGARLPEHEELSRMQSTRFNEFALDWVAQMQEAKKQGLVRYIGFSSHEHPEIIKSYIDMGVFDLVLMQYNLLDQSNEEVFAYAHEHGMATTVMGPVGGGRLGEHSDELIKAAPAGVMSTPELALRFVLSNPNINAAFSGMCEIEEIDENVAAASVETPLTPEQRARVLKVVKEKTALAEAYCTSCNYCQPCENNVAISSILNAMALHKVWGLTRLARKQYSVLGKGPRAGKAEPATACTECGDCEEKCPQKIPIRERIKEAHEALAEE